MASLTSLELDMYLINLIILKLGMERNPDSRMFLSSILITVSNVVSLKEVSPTWVKKQNFLCLIKLTI